MLPRIEIKLAQHSHPVDLLGNADHMGRFTPNYDRTNLNTEVLAHVQPQLGLPEVVDWVSRCWDLLRPFVYIANPSLHSHF